ncbi:hypothetical protein A6V39_05165 [Candidatus Mycoplasma haematobovis]|uniref:Uncharacterized protein n=1 Tax=Candidatus Mycoplasma haematobovis TaxID=432608 RepID=A0A1A9QC47_9MOLU|nr:hypothetical protein [Candidatus Mycoplasma haematobovis]OAL09818.1 hypothetical protein A6V39_05165 [Candidatus Mycoplasma haematobovis]
MGVSPVHVAGVVLTGGLVTGGYFTYQALVPPTLEGHLKSLGLELAGSSDWVGKAEQYKKTPNSYPISTITDPAKDNDVAGKLQTWCEKKKGKNFLGETDQTYQKFSVWCLVTQDIKAVLEKRGKKALSLEEKAIKVTAYNATTNTDKFIANKPNGIVEADLTKWCEEKEKVNYQHEADANFKKVIEWCYSK